MRIVVVSTPGVGHLLPLLPLARAARDRGHEVIIAAGSSLAGHIAAAGFPQVVVGPAIIADVVGGIPGIGAMTGRRRAFTVFREAFCGPIASDMAAALGGLFETHRPDLIVHEDLAFGASLAAEHHGIPHATVQATAWRPNVVDLAAEPLERVRATLGMAGDPDPAHLFGSIYFTTRPRSLRDPDAPSPPNMAELQPSADDRGGAAGEPLGERTARPRVAATLGTVNGHELDVLRQIVAGSIAAGAEVIVALGADPSTYGRPPTGVTVRAYLPMSELLPTVDGVAFHGGSGTMLAAAAAGVPMVIVPFAADQLDNADRCLAAGIAQVVPLAELSVAAAQAAVEAVLTDAAYRQRAEQVAAEIAAMPSADAAVERLEAAAGS